MQAGKLKSDPPPLLQVNSPGPDRDREGPREVPCELGGGAPVEALPRGPAPALDRGPDSQGRPADQAPAVRPLGSVYRTCE